MRRNELDHILGAMLESQKEVSDLNITVDKPLQVESYGQLAAVALSPSIDKLVSCRLRASQVYFHCTLPSVEIKNADAPSDMYFSGRPGQGSNIFASWPDSHVHYVASFSPLLFHRR